MLAGRAVLGYVPTIRAAGPSLTFGPESVIYANGSTGNQMRQHCDAGGTCLNIWPDTPLGAVPDGSGYDWYAASSGVTAKTIGPLDDPAQTVDYAARPVTGSLPAGLSYAGIGSVWQDAADGLLFGFVHLERWPHGCPQCFWASLALAVSPDNGSTWNYLGEIFQHNLPYDDSSTPPHEAGPGAHAVVHPSDDPQTAYLYLYAMDWQASGVANLAVERARVADLVAAARGQAPLPSFAKYDGGGWTSPGLGGPSTNIGGALGRQGAPTSISFNTALNEYVMATNDYATTPGVADLTLDVGTDPGQPVNFDTARGAHAYTLAVGHDVIYGSIVQPGSGTPTSTSGSSFDVYYVGWERRCTWDCADLAVRTVTVGDQPPTSSSSSGFTSTQGENGWSYQGSTNGEQSYRNMSWDAADQRWQGSELYCIAAAGWQHPGVACDSVRVWTAPGAGDLAIGANGPIAVAASCGGNTAGVDVRILKNGAQIWPAAGSVNLGNGTSTPFRDLTTSVAPYDQVQFVVAHAGSSNNCDTTSWDQTVTFQPGLHKASSGFTSAQGQNGWSYEGSADGERTLSSMSWDAGNSRWQGSELFCLVGSGWQHPGVACDSVRVWTAPTAGTVTLGANGSIGVAAGCGGNTAGVNIAILKNGAQVWPATGMLNVPNGGSLTFPPGIGVTVTAGDQLQFVVAHAGSVNYCDTTTWDQTITDAAAG
jgi:hypothetical protein